MTEEYQRKQISFILYLLSLIADQLTVVSHPVVQAAHELATVSEHTTVKGRASSHVAYSAPHPYNPHVEIFLSTWKAASIRDFWTFDKIFPPEIKRRVYIYTQCGLVSVGRTVF